MFGNSENMVAEGRTKARGRWPGREMGYADDDEGNRMNANQKGKRGEREAAAALRDTLGIDARRGQQFSGGDDSPDVKHSLDGVHIEVKRTEKLKLAPSLEQAADDAGEKVPVVMWRRNHGEWFMIVPLSRVEELSRLIADRL